METRVRASIALDESVLRYAEVEQYGSRTRLLRLGSCRFDFDAAAALVRGGNAEGVVSVREAVADVFSGTAATDAHLVCASADVCSFFAPFRPALPEPERREQLHQEAALLVNTGEALHLTTEAASASVPGQGGALDWVHVLALPQQAHARLLHALAALPVEERRCRWHASTHGIARATRKLAAMDGDGSGGAEKPRGTTLAIGWYGAHVEYTLCSESGWRISRCDTEGGNPADVAYFALALLDRAGGAPEAVERIFVYGEAPMPKRVEPLQTVFGVSPVRLDPMRLIDLDPNSLTEGFDTSAYAPCLGVLF